MSTFNFLLHGDADGVAEYIGEAELDNGELRAALSNALRRIAALEQRFGNVTFAARLNAETIHNMAQASAESGENVGR